MWRDVLHTLITHIFFNTMKELLRLSLHNECNTLVTGGPLRFHAQQSPFSAHTYISRTALGGRCGIRWFGDFRHNGECLSFLFFASVITWEVRDCLIVELWRRGGRFVGVMILFRLDGLVHNSNRPTFLSLQIAHEVLAHIVLLLTRNVSETTKILVKLPLSTHTIGWDDGDVIPFGKLDNCVVDPVTISCRHVEHLID